MVARPPQPDITGKYAAYLHAKGMACHYPAAWRNASTGGCIHPDHDPLPLVDLTRGDVNLIELALRMLLITEYGTEHLRERVKNVLRRVEREAVPKA